ncbi:hypothetical protein F5Y07DRAFT_237858 [Xylaria sp. FL0933]|nr:hypothetical protein F5Y07DRAFT_237858 [Xylaria sp. FL0933]
MASVFYDCRYIVILLIWPLDQTLSEFSNIFVRQSNISVTTNITSNGQAVTVSINATEAISDFQAALEAEGVTYDGDVEIAATRLINYDGCNTVRRGLIYQGWIQSWKIMNQILKEVDNMNWNEAAAVEYLGPPGLNKGVQADIQRIFRQWATIQPGYITTPFDWRLHVRCDDPKGKCGDPCNFEDPGPYAYTTNRDSDSGIARINFCPLYFMTLDLDTAIKNGKDSSMGSEWVYNVDSYMMNKAHVWAHELMHIDWATKANDYGPNKHVSDIRMWAKQAVPPGEPPVWQEFKANGAQAVKALARFSGGAPRGQYVAQNADSLALYASVRYIQAQLGNVYPHLPLSPAAPDSVYDPNNPESDGIGPLPIATNHLAGWDLYKDGTVALPAVENLYSYSHDTPCPFTYPDDNSTLPPFNAVYDEDTEDDPDYAFNFTAFATADDFDQSYTDQLNSWWGGLYMLRPIPRPRQLQLRQAEP